MFKKETVTAVLFIFLSSFGAKLNAQENCSPQLLESIDPGPFNGNTGYSISLSGNRLLIGAPFEDNFFNDDGSAFLFTRSESGWSYTTHIQPNNADAFRFFGFSVAIDGDDMIIGAPKYFFHDSIGSAYVFHRQGNVWVQQAELIPNDGQADDQFGISVGIWNDVAVVGAWTDSTPISKAGSAYVFRRFGSQWVQEQKLTADDAQANDAFGSSVSIAGDTLAVGAISDDDRGSAAGAVYMFLRSGTSWSQQAKLTASDGEAFDSFGYSVSMSGERVLVGSPFDNSPLSDAGSAYVFRRDGSTWVQEAHLFASDAAGGERYGRSVSMDGFHLVVGASRDSNERGFQAGSAYFYSRVAGLWVGETKLVPPQLHASDWAGFSVAIDEQSVALGAPGDANVVFQEGRGFVYPIDCLNPPVATIVASIPADGTIDARQPGPLHGGAPQGFAAVGMTFVGSIKGMTVEDFEVTEFGGDQVPPPVAGIFFPDFESAVLGFSHAFEPGTWTKITHIPSGSKVSLGYLPGDCDGSGIATPGDILALINSLNGIAPRPIYSTDIDRSGQANSMDILRIIDLLNGADAFEVWNGVALPERP